MGDLTGAQMEIQKADGDYTVEISLQGGTGRASLKSPAELYIKDKAGTVKLEWSSSNYDYMKLNGEMYQPVATDPGSVFELPVTAMDEPVEVIADTTAMSTPHEITYTIELDSATIKSSKGDAGAGGWLILPVLLAVAVVVVLKRRRKSKHEAFF